MNTPTKLLQSIFAVLVSLSAGVPPEVIGANDDLRFEEVFVHSLGSYWCELNRLTVVDVDADGQKDIVALVTTYVGGTERY